MMTLICPPAACASANPAVPGRITECAPSSPIRRGQNFPRVRVGVGAKPDGWDLADWVLSKYTIREEQIAMQQAFERAADCVEDWVKNGIDHAMQEYNKTV
ncbi:MAG: hypothetical protein ACLTXW_03345 [Christensenellales bacterium]